MRPWAEGGTQEILPAQSSSVPVHPHGVGQGTVAPLLMRTVHTVCRVTRATRPGGGGSAGRFCPRHSELLRCDTTEKVSART